MSMPGHEEGRAMKRISRIGVVVATFGLTLTLSTSGANAATITTPPLDRPPGGYLNCTVTAKSAMPIAIVAKIVTRDGADVTDFGTGFRASPDAMGDGLYHAEETAGSFNEGAWTCRTSVNGARRRDVEAVLEARDKDGNVIGQVKTR
jgi:hypothetical protein